MEKSHVNEKDKKPSMKLTARLAYSQLKINKRRTIWTVLGIVITTAMITTVYGLVASSSDFVNALVGSAATLREQYELMLAGLGMILSGFIVISSVIVLSNAFRVSARERINQFGILKSVGATKKQINQIVVHESLFLALIGVPIGVVVGLAIQLIGVGLINYMLADIFAYGWDQELGIRFVLSWTAILLSIALAFVTVFLSAWFPARKASKIPAIDAIRGAGEVKFKGKKLRGGWLVGKIFGFEGVLAVKSLKRNKRNFRATVIALSLSVGMLITLGSFVSQLNSLMNLSWFNVDATASVTFHSSTAWIHDDFEEEYYQISRYRGLSVDEVTYITDRFKEHSKGEVIGIGNGSWDYYTTLSRDEITPQMIEWIEAITVPGWHEEGDQWNEFSWNVNKVTLDSLSYQYLVESLGLPYGSNILFNHTWSHTLDGHRKEFVPLHFSGQTLEVFHHNSEQSVEITLHGQARLDQVPPEMMLTFPQPVTIIVPELEVMRYTWFVNADNPAAFIDYAQGVMGGMNLYPGDSYWFVNIQQDQEWTRALVNVVLLFMWGFVALLTSIYLTNIISTISTNVQSRAKEFAMLRSVGMTSGGLNKVLSLESILSSVKGLIVGIPLGIGGAYLVYMAVGQAAEFPFRLPFGAIGLSVLGVFVLIWIVTGYSAKALKRRNIVETIRGDSGM